MSDETGEHLHPDTNGIAIVDLLSALGAANANKMTWKWQLVTFARQLAVAVVTSAVIIAALVIGFAGQTAAEIQREQDTLHANLAQACVLALPVTDEGRDPKDVKLCFTQYDLQAPSLQH